MAYTPPQGDQVYLNDVVGAYSPPAGDSVILDESPASVGAAYHYNYVIWEGGG